MKITRLLTYAISGIIAGLLLENGSLRLRQKTGQKARELKRHLDKKVSG